MTFATLIEGLLGSDLPVAIRGYDGTQVGRSEAGLASQVQVRLQDYRDVDDGPYDAISSIGMFEHVGLARLREYFERLYRLVRPGGRVLNHGISRQPEPDRVRHLRPKASALNFEAGRTGIHQVLAVRPDQRGASGMPLRPRFT